MGYNYPEYPYHEDADDYDHWENDCGLFEDESDGLLWCGSAARRRVRR